MKSIGYGVIETVGSSDRKAGRVDSCGLYFCEEKWECLDHETIRLDDLAILRSSSQSEGQNGQTRDTTIDNSNIIKKKNRINRHDRNNTNNGSLKGFERSFVRSNVTLLARMKHKESMEQVVIVSCMLPSLINICNLRRILIFFAFYFCLLGSFSFVLESRV